MLSETEKKMGGLIALLVVLILIVLILASCIKIVPQAQAYVVERLGAYQRHGLWDCISKSPSLIRWQKELS